MKNMLTKLLFILLGGTAIPLLFFSIKQHYYGFLISDILLIIQAIWETDSIIKNSK